MYKRDEILEISDFEPCFMHLFGIIIPENLKPRIENTLPSKLGNELSIWQLKSIEKIEEYLKQKIENERINSSRLRTLPESLNNNIEFLKVSSEFDSFKNMTKKELRNSKNELRKFIKIKWLSNDVYQIGIKSTSTKDYFKYTAKTEKREVAIRFKIWFQYEKSNEDRLEKISQFLQEFERFEEQVKDYVKSMIFDFDELGNKEMKLELTNSILIERKGSGMHPSLSFDFNELYEAIKINTGKNRV